MQDFDLVVIGGGAAGLVAAKTANGMGLNVAIIEKRKLGGECTWFGCVPSKAFIRAAQIASNIRNMEKYGLRTEAKVQLKTDDVMSHVRAIVGRVYNGHSPEVLKESGITILTGSPSFIDDHHVGLGDETIRAKKFVIATGSSAAVPPIEGRDSTSYLTNENFFDMDKLPRSLVVIGGGPIGIELSQAASSLGVETTVIEMLDTILPKEDRELRILLDKKLKSEGLSIYTSTKVAKLAEKDGQKAVTIESREKQFTELLADEVLIAAGRRPNIDGLELEKAGIEYNVEGIITDKRLKTSASTVYACGDVVGPFQFSHISEYQAVIAVTNAFLPIKRKVDYRNVIWATFTDPELAHAGLTEEEARDRYGDSIKVYSFDYNKTDRARTDVEEFGRSKFILNKKGKLIGAHILGPRASDVIHEAQILKSFDHTFTRLQSVIHVYPSYSDVIRQPAKYALVEKLKDNKLLKIGQSLLFGRR